MKILITQADTNKINLAFMVVLDQKTLLFFRHHDPDHFSQIFSAWKQLRKETRAGKTLSENQINITQLLYKKG